MSIDFSKLSKEELFEKVKQIFKDSKKKLGKANIILAG